MGIKKLAAASLLCAVLAGLAGCVQYPTERQSVVDLRPQISFRFDPADARMTQARVVVNGLDSGRMADRVMDGAFRALWCQAFARHLPRRDISSYKSRP